MKQTKTTATAAYMRLSSEDDKNSESASISNQRMIINDYCDKRGMVICKEYVDDGYSGATFDRPAFNRLLKDIEAGEINCVITKDLSRLGRNHVMAGMFIYEYFPKTGVRYISISDNIDTAEGESEIAPYLNIHNELMVRETSRKVKAAMLVKYKNGDYVSTVAPIGYIKDPEDHCHLIPDPETAGIVKRIFDMTAHGVGKSKICKIFEEERVPTPGWIYYQRSGKSFANAYMDAPEEKRYQWSVHAVAAILNNEAYIGNSVHYKQVKVSFRTKATKRNPEENWLRVENTHEPIIEKELWDAVHKNRDTKQFQNKSGEENIFAGLVKCTDCGRSMCLKHSKSKENGKEKKSFECTTYKHYGKTRCSMHFISYSELYALIFDNLQNWIHIVNADKDKIYEIVSDRKNQAGKSELKQLETELKNAEKRLTDKNRHILKLFEDRNNGVISEKNYLMMIKSYEAEQTSLENVVNECKAKIAEAETKEDNTKAWIELISKYRELNELNKSVLNELIEKIVIHAPEKNNNGKRTQKVDIYYRIIGNIDR